MQPADNRAELLGIPWDTRPIPEINEKTVGGKMTIRSRNRLAIPYTSEAFPPGSTPNGSANLTVTWADILWAALTIGRPSVHHVFQHGTSSLHEAIFRISLVRMALDQSGPQASRFRRSAAYKALDPTEKGAISYFLGMTFCKLFASRLLRTPWMLHLDVYRATMSTSNLGRSRPDLIGQQIGTGNWLAFETKGRASKPSGNDLVKAKSQAQRLVSVGGASCALHIATFAYFLNDTLNFHWIDPPSEAQRPVALPAPREAWSHYYEPARALWATGTESERKATAGILLPLSEFDLTLGVHPLLEPFFTMNAWEEAQRAMFEAADELEAEGFQPDGLKIECGPTWMNKFGLGGINEK